MTDTAAIQFAVDAIIATNGGKTFVSKVHSDSVRAALVKLLEAYGVYGLENKVSADELAMLYASTRNSHTQGLGVANGLQKKYAANPLLDDTPLKPKAVPTPAPSVPAYQPPAKDADDAPGHTASDLLPIWNELRRKASHGDLDALNERVTETLRKVTDALPAVIDDKMMAVAMELERRNGAYIDDAVADAIKAQTPTRVEITQADAPTVVLGLTHKQTPRVIRMLAAGVNVYLYGPAGTGKTTAGQQCADAFKLPFYFAAKVESEYMLLGFKDARGETVRTQFREAYEHGGVFLFDELDGSSAGAVVALNAALANGVCPFPDGVIARHANFKCIAAGNTALSGATRQYVGRNQLDAASVDRFAFLPFGYDDELERAVATDQQWCKYVQAVRSAVAARALPHLVTPRATYDGCKLIAAGDTPEEAADAVIWKGLDRDTVTQLQAAVGPLSDYYATALAA